MQYLRIYNTTKTTVISNELKVAQSLLDKSLGLLFRKNPCALLFFTRFGVHTFGLGFSIDIIILDKNDRVVKLKTNCLPNTFFFWNPKYNKVVELPQGLIRKSQTQLGDQIKIYK